MTKTITFVGDVCLAGRTLQDTARAIPVLAPALRALAVGETCLVGTVEAPISDRGVPKPHKACLRAGSRLVGALSGFDVGLLGNNHMEDFGPEAAEDTQAALRRIGCQPVGYGPNLTSALAPVIIDLGDAKAAILSVCCLTTRADGFATDRVPGVAPLSLQLLQDAIRSARRDADLVIVCPHWGVQGSALPSLDDLLLARAAIDCGAHAVVGTHAHVIQACETYHGAPIAYGLGNYLFDDLDLAYVDHQGRPTGQRYQVRQSADNRGSLVISLRPVKVGSSWRLEPAGRWIARQDGNLGLSHEVLVGETPADRRLATQLARLPLDLSVRDEPSYLCSVRDGILVFNHRLPPLDRLSFTRAALLRLEGKARALLRRLRAR